MRTATCRGVLQIYGSGEGQCHSKLARPCPDPRKSIGPPCSLCPPLVPGIDLGAPVKQLFEDVQVPSAAGPEHRGPVQLQNKSTRVTLTCRDARRGVCRGDGPSLVLTKSRASTVAPASSSLFTSWL